EETQKRVERSEVASQLAARMAHEIKNPLNSIGLIVDYLRDHFRPELKGDQVKFGELSENIKTELARLNDIVERFLRFAKPAIASKRPVDVTRLVEEILAFILPEAERQGVQLRSHLGPAMPQVDGDYLQLRQALLNLFINALQAMPDGGNIEVNASVSSTNDIEIV